MAAVKYFSVNRQDQSALEDLENQVNAFIAGLTPGTPVSTSLRFGRYEIAAEIAYGDGIGGMSNMISVDESGNVTFFLDAEHKQAISWNPGSSRYEFTINEVVVGVCDVNGFGQPGE